MNGRASGRARRILAGFALALSIATMSCSSPTEARTSAMVGGLAISIAIFPSPAAIGDTIVATLTIVNTRPQKLTRAFGAIGPHMRVESGTAALGPSPFPPRFFLDVSNSTIVFSPQQRNLFDWMYSAVSVGTAVITACVPTLDQAPSDSVCVSDEVRVNAR
jgi:hypothetical protein